jgi:hypothetical protein
MALAQSPSPATPVPFTGTTQPRTTHPAPKSTSDFVRLIVSTCEFHCNVPYPRFDATSPCTCQEDCNGPDKYGESVFLFGPASLRC